MEHFVIIGNGTAGNCAAETLRLRDRQIRITIISAEPTPYVYRHRLARFLVSQQELEELRVHPPEWYEQRNLRLRLNQPVVQVDPLNRKILLAHRERISYDRLLICSGARHRVPEYLSHFAAHLSRFSTSIDAIKLKKKLPRIKRLALLGGDLIGLQLASALLPAGKEIIFIMDQYRFWPLETDDEMKDELADALRGKGMEVLRDDYVTELERKGDQGPLRIRTRSGRELEVDEAILCAGMVPALEFLSDSGIDVQQGVLVNERLEASAQGVWAAGECAEIYYPELKDYRCSTGYLNACVQGELAAVNMLGGRETVSLGEPGGVVIAGRKYQTRGWKGFSLDEKD